MNNTQLSIRHTRKSCYLFGYLWVAYFSAGNLIVHAEEPGFIPPTCTLGKSVCTFPSATASLSDNTIVPLIPTTLTVALENSVHPYLLVELQGVKMNMGTYKLKLTSIENNQYVGELMLPICMKSKMTWQGFISSPDKQLMLPIDVVVTK